MATSNRKCSLPTCSSSEPLQIYKKQGILKVIECALQRKDDDMQTRMQTILDSQGEQSLIEMHKNCYCSYTSKEHIKRLLGKKRKEGRVDIDDAPAARMRRSQVTGFDFNRVSTSLKSTLIYRTVLKSPWKLNLPWKVLEKHLKTLKSPWILPFTGGFNTVFGDLNHNKIVVPLFGAAYAAPNKGTTILY